ncbi:hypothetical protein Tco_1244893 [Tanacetum coccineum]
MNDYEESAGIQEYFESDLQSMPDDDLRSVFGFEAADSDDTNDNEVSHSAHTSHDIASAERLSIPYHMDHICEEVSYLHSRLGNMEYSIVQIVSDEIKSSLPAMITNALQEQLPRILLATLKDCLPLIVKESLQTHHPLVSEQFAETQSQLNKKVVKQLNRQFNISHVAQSNRFVTFQKELSKVIKSEVAKKVQVVGLKGVQEGGSNPKALTPFSTPEGPLSQEEFDKQIKELKRISDLKAGKEKSKQELRKLLNPATLKAQAQKWTDHEAKKAKMMEEYNHQISFRADKLSITKISYVVNSRKRGNYEDHQRAKFQWVINQAKRLGLPPPPELATFGLTAKEKKMKRAEFIKEMFMTEDVRCDNP